MSIKELAGRAEAEWQTHNQGYYCYAYPDDVPPKPTHPRRLDIDDAQRIKRFDRAYGGAISDACLQCGIVDNVLSHDLKPLRPGSVIIGRALPVKWHSQAPESRMSEADYLARQTKWKQLGSPQKQMHAAIEPGHVLVFDTGHDLHAAQFGEMSCTLARARGAEGVINSGMTRDVRKINRMDGFAYFSRGTTPNAYGMGRPLEVNVPIWMPGHLTHYVPIYPGDFIFGDEDGLQTIPSGLVDEVLLKVEEILDFEDAEREQIDQGMPIDEVFAEFGDL
jgi:regulator of RNase E activity RraA